MTVLVIVEVIVSVIVCVTVAVTVGLGAMTDTVGHTFISYGSSVPMFEANISDLTTKFAVPGLDWARAPGPVPPPYVTVMVPPAGRL